MSLASDRKEVSRSNWVLHGAMDPKACYLIFAFASTAMRSFEAGIVSSMMPQIQEDLHLNYMNEGVVASAADYGTIASGLLAIIAFKYIPAYYVLTFAYLVSAVVCFLCGFFPSKASLMMARALGQLFFGMANVHYPTWINAHCDKSQRTTRIALLSVSLLVGILLGYVVGGIAKATGTVRWPDLYIAVGVLMAVCTLWGAAFSKEHVQVVGKTRDKTRDEEEEEGAASSSAPSIAAGASADEATPLMREGKKRSSEMLGCTELCTIFSNRLYLATLCMGSTVAAIVAFILYFITQMADILAYTNAETTGTVAVMFFLGPVAGNLLGAFWLNKVGGYQNHVPATRLLGFWTSSAAFISFFIPLAMIIRDRLWMHLIFDLLLLGILLCGSCPVAAIQGMAVSLVPGLDHYASGIMFFVQHIAKMLAPIVGGAINDAIGLRPGFCVMVASLGILYAAGAWWSYREALARLRTTGESK